jgi:WD40 repeat protein
VWDAQTGQEQLSLKGHTRGVNSVAFGPDGKRIVSGSEDQTVKVWDALSGQQTLSLKGHKGGITSVAFSSDGKRIASGSDDRTVKVWDAQTGKETLSLQGHTGGVSSVCFSPDGKRIVSGSLDQTVKVWDAQTGQEALSLKGHMDRVTRVCFSPDGKRIASGSRDGTVKVWDAQTGQEALSLQGDTGEVTSVTFSPDGKRIVASDMIGNTIVWDASDGKVLPDEKVNAGGRGPRSQDGSLLAVPDGDVIRVYALTGKVALEAGRARTARLSGMAAPHPAWHREQVEQSFREANWFAAAFHLDRLLRLFPWNPSLHLQRSFALQQLGRSAEAVAHQLHAVLLDPHVRWKPPRPSRLTMPRAGDGP